MQVADLNCFTSPSAQRDQPGQGPLDGVRVAVKDLVSLAGHTSSFGHSRWRETREPASRDAPIITALLAAGASIVGTTKMDQLAFSLIGDAGEGEAPLNTFDAGSYCGGSSSGSASAVAGELADLGIGTDTAGSMRVPAAACGLFSIRPTHGAIDATGVIPLAPSFDVIGLFAREPKLLSLALEVLGVAKANGSPTQILLPFDAWATHSEHERFGARHAAQRLSDRFDATVIEAELGDLVNDEAGDLLARLQSREIWAQHSDWVRHNSGALASDVRTRLERCELLAADTDEVKEADTAAHKEYVATLLRAIPTGTIALVPVRPRPGPRRDWGDAELFDFRRGAFRLAAPGTLGGLPQVVAPTFTNSRYTPLGLIGARDSDFMLVDAAGHLVSEVEGATAQ